MVSFLILLLIIGYALAGWLGFGAGCVYTKMKCNCKNTDKPKDMVYGKKGRIE